MHHERKSELRRILKERRALIDKDVSLKVAEVVARIVNDIIQDDEAVVAGYFPINAELDFMPTMKTLHRRGIQLCLPDVHLETKNLTFRLWAPGDELSIGPFQLSLPSLAAAEVTPSHICIPFLGFDKKGNRLGYGGGFYDRTLAVLRKTARITAIGIGYACQEVDDIHESYGDQRMDYVVTEEGIRTFA